MTLIGHIQRSAGLGAYFVRPNEDHERLDAPPVVPFGAFVRTPSKNGDIIMVVSSVQALDNSNPEHNALFRDEQPFDGLFKTGLGDRVTLLTCYPVGHQAKEGPVHGFTTAMAAMGGKAYLMTDEEIKDFHLLNGELRVGYFQAATKQRLIPRSTVQLALSKLQTLMPEQSEDLRMLESVLHEAGDWQ